MSTVLLISNRRLDENHGRAEKFRFRKEKLNEYGWDVKIGYVNSKYGTGPLPPLSGVVRCLKLAKKHDVEVIQTVSEPYLLHIVGMVVKEIIGIPWIVEFRDPMVTKPSIELNSNRAKIRKFFERKIIRKSDKVLWADGIQIPEKYFEKNYSEFWDKINAFQAHGVNIGQLDSISPTEYENFTLTYAGSFYEGWIEPYSLLKSVRSYIQRWGEPIQIQFFGDWRENYTEFAKSMGIWENILVHDWIDPVDLIDILAGSDGLIYIGGTDPRNSTNIPSKIYDYITAQTPIIGLVDPSFHAAKFIENHNAGIVVSPENKLKIAEAINEVRIGNAPTVDQLTLEEYSRENSIKQFKNALDEVST